MLGLLEVLISPHACTDEAAWEVWGDLVIHISPRASNDYRRKNNLVTSEEVQQEIEKCLVLLGDGKIEESLVLVYDVIYEVGSKSNRRVTKNIKNGYFDDDW